VRVHRDRRLQFAGAEDLDQRLATGDEAQLAVILQTDFGYSELGEPVEVDDRVFGAEDIGEAALGEAAMERHLAALEAAHQAGTGARSLAFVAAG